ncbi:UV radiation resistance-associated gene -like [Olea europaea subsp. europaea]|uniref:UV radiation resistance-associated gene -like n=1 Tax=Olea europaea subsp. europaea TaxID=158383 RepID=A0A8S0PGS8_OLEEU|nr:UV radiation resistance-associated gene -like [Olea europaea subsp. europaea]
MGLPLTCNRIIDRNLYGKNGTPWDVFSNNDPWEIVGDSEVDVLKKEIYVFTKLEKRRSSRIVRVAGCGTWDGKCVPKDIENGEGEVIGFKKSFTFKVNGNLTQDELNKKHDHWIMHEYTLNRSPSEVVDNTDYAVCRISWELLKCCVEEGSWPTRNQALHDQELNSKADSSWPTKMSDNEFSSLIEERNWNHALHDQEQNSEANLPLPEMTHEEGVPSGSKPVDQGSLTISSLHLTMIPFTKMSFFTDKEEVPLLYPLLLGGSRSYIRDYAPAIDHSMSSSDSYSDLEELLNFIGVKRLGPHYVHANLKELLRTILSSEYIGM